MMKACKDDVYFIHSFKWPEGTFDRIQDFKGENASKNIQTMINKHCMNVSDLIQTTGNGDDVAWNLVNNE